MRKVVYFKDNKSKLYSLVTAADDRIDVERIIQLTVNAPVSEGFLGYFGGPEGKHPVHYLKISATNTRPALTIFYSPDIGFATVVDVFETQD